MKKGRNRYVVYDYWNGEKKVSMYCGKEGESKTEQKLKAAKLAHYESKQERSKKKLLG